MKSLAAIMSVSMLAMLAGCATERGLSSTTAPASGPAGAAALAAHAGGQECTTTLMMKANRVVVRSGGCPDGADATALSSHTADVEAAVRQLQPGEQTTVSTDATPHAP